jgi:hypothetical protein
MPQSGRAAVSSGARHSRRTSQSGTDHHHRREKTKSSQSYTQRPSRDSSSHTPLHPASTGSGTTQAQRPSQSRAHSTPQLPKSQLLGPEDGDDSDGDALDSDPAEDEEIADDPFFQRFDMSQTEEELRSPTASQDSDTEGPLSPTSTQMRHRPDSTAQPLGSPLSPRSPISVCVYDPNSMNRLC